MSEVFSVPESPNNNEIDIGAMAKEQAKASGVNPESYAVIPEEQEIDIGEIAKRQTPGFEPMNIPPAEFKKPLTPEEKAAFAQQLKVEGQTGMREALGELETPANVQQQAAEQLRKIEGGEKEIVN